MTFRGLCVVILGVCFLLPSMVFGGGDVKKKEEVVASIDKQRADLVKLSDQIWAFAETALLETNKQLKTMVEDTPNRFRDMASENKRLVKETSDMHYNLGVFYVNKRDYPMAIKEFQRALEINPNNAKAHYNLGYLYSEQLEQHDQAMAHFKRYLEIDPHSKESEVVRSYMLVRQVYGDRPVRK